DTKTPYARVDDPFQKISPTKLVAETPDKANAFLLASRAIPINDLHSDFAALLVANQILGGSTESRLPNRLRTQDGLSYSVGSALQPSSIDANSKFLVYAIFAPQNLSRVEEGINAVFAQSLSTAPSAKEIEDAKKSLLEERAIARAQDKAQAGNLVSQLFLNRTWKESLARDQAIAAVTAEDVHRVIRQYLSNDAFVYSIAGTFKNAGQDKASTNP
ncbi:MAG: insulinase family protein, partial [Burkholderiales bacterium]|nr:insulinase family protein [Burkholderiales bacterium]